MSTAKTFRTVHAALTDAGLSMTKAELCYLVLASGRVFAHATRAAAVAWQREVEPDLTHVRRRPRPPT